MSLLEIELKEAGYDSRPVLRSVSVSLESGDFIAVVGPNGSGKSTLLKVLVGALPYVVGYVRFDGQSIYGLPPEVILKKGIRLVPQGANTFSGLTVKENLETGGYLLPRGELGNAIERSLAMFPVLKKRLNQRAETLSGGERQQLALAQALVLVPKVLLLDEPSVGLAHPLVVEVLDTIANINITLGTTIVVVEQRVREILNVAKSAWALKNGRIAYRGLSNGLADESLLKTIFTS